MNYWDGDRYCDGPGIAAWLEQEWPDYRQRGGPSAARRVVCWRHGERADVYSLDRILVSLGSHPSEIPDELWEVSQRRERGSRRKRRVANGQFA
jgi:hypothetical protein